MRPLLYLLLSCLLFITPGCGRVNVDFTDPEAVTQQFMRSQAGNNRSGVNAVITPELKNKFKAQKLYLGDRVKLRKSQLKESEIRKAWDEPTKKVYQLNYAVSYLEGKETKTLRLREAVSLINKEGNWYIDDYAPELR